MLTSNRQSGGGRSGARGTGDIQQKNISYRVYCKLIFQPGYLRIHWGVELSHPCTVHTVVIVPPSFTNLEKFLKLPSSTRWWYNVLRVYTGGQLRTCLYYPTAIKVLRRYTVHQALQVPRYSLTVPVLQHSGIPDRQNNLSHIYMTGQPFLRYTFSFFLFIFLFFLCEFTHRK